MNETKFDINGQEVKVVQKSQDGRYFVFDVYEGMDDPFCDENHPRIVDKVFDKPPKKKYTEEIIKLKYEIKELKRQTKNAKKVRLGEEKKKKERLEKLKKLDQLKNLEDFIDGKITHYVDICNWSVPEIIKIGEVDKISDVDNPFRLGQKLLTLYGGSNGNMEWKLSEYKDGSGSNHTVIPCLSHNEATEKVKEWLVVQFAKKDLMYHDEEIIKLAKSMGVPIPQEYIDGFRNEEKKNIEKQLNEKEKEITRLRERGAYLDKI